MSVTVTLGGTVLGGTPPPAPIAFNGTLDAQGMHFTALGADPLGDCTGTVLTSGAVTAHCVNLPSDAVASFDVSGTWQGSAGNLSYTVTFKDGRPPATGTVMLARG